MAARARTGVSASAAKLTIGICLTAIAACSLAPGTAAAEVPQLIWKAPEDGLSGSGAGRLDHPHGVAADPSTGHVFVAEAVNARISEFTAWGEFVKAWGWGVRNGASELQTCGPGATPPSETCQKGISGSGAGQFLYNPAAGGGTPAIAIDGVGDVYVADVLNARVEKFDSEGHFLLAFGEEVDKTSGADVCTALSGHVCGAGVEGEADGQFTTELGVRMAMDSAGTIFVGDPNGRVQEFEASGAFKAKVTLEGEPFVTSLAIDASGHFYVVPGRFDKHIYKYDSDGTLLLTVSTKFNVEYFEKSLGENLTKTVELQAQSPLAVDPAGNLYAVVTNVGELGEDLEFREVIEFSPSGALLMAPGAGVVAAEDTFGNSPILTGLATNIVDSSGAIDLYAAVASAGAPGFVVAFGALPEKWLPPVKPPQIASQYATSVDAQGATLKAKINPRFWKDTTYYVEYGTGECSEGECEETRPAPPGSLLSSAGGSSQVTTKGVFLTDLEPATTYHYRFVAQSSGGGPVRGVGGVVGTDGSEATFTTPALPSPPPSPDPCENAPFRGGLQAYLADCRAYEMVSPVDKNGADIRPLLNINSNPTALDVSAVEGGRFTYSTYQAFGDAVSGPFVSQYLATREEGGWSSHGISPPRGVSLIGVGPSLDVQFKAFSEDLCSGWLLQDTDLLLAEGAVEGFSNLYRSNLCGEGYEALTTAEPPTVEPKIFVPELQGVSADGEHAVFQAKDKLTADANEGEAGKGSNLQLYESSGGALHLVSVLPDGAPSKVNASAGTHSSEFSDNRSSTVLHALPADGSRVYWTTAGSGSGPIGLYLRTNPAQPESARLHGAASGTGDLIGPAKGTGATVVGSKNIANLTVTSGAFAVGQTITGPGIPAATTITEVQPKKLKISKEATATSLTAALTGAASEFVSNVNTETGAFAAGQEISGSGIAAATTVLAVEEGGAKLKLSAKASGSKTGAALAATSPCTEAAKACTVEVAAAGSFWDAATDGSRALYTVGDLNSGASLFEYDAEASKSTLLAGKVRGLLGMSADASRVYLVSKEALAAGATAGELNLYLREAGGGFRFVAALADAPALESALPYAFSLTPNLHLAQVSPDGQHVAFMTAGSPTGFDNTDAVSGEADEEVYLYDASAEGGAGKLLCVSCNPSGVRPTGAQLLNGLNGTPGLWAAAQITPAEFQLYAPRVLSASGGRLFFESLEALVARDTNGVQDVYEWEAPGEGSCTEEDPTFNALNGGCVSLISSGQSATDTQFVDASADGTDVFIRTGASLLPQDPGLVDIYDARVGGGFPQPPPPPAACEGEACQGTPEAPNDPTPSSESFEGAGNVKEEAPIVRKPCAKGKVRRHGKCVARHVKKHHRRAKHSRRAGR